MLMLKNRPFIILCFFLLFLCCKKEISITFSETNFTSANNRIVEVNIPLVEENNDIGRSINLAIKNYVIASLQIEEKDLDSISVEESIENFNKSYSNFINEFHESAQEWDAQIDGEVIYKSEDVIVTQSYSVAINPSANDDAYVIANQDNDTYSKVNGTWYSVAMGDGIQSAINYNNSNILVLLFKITDFPLTYHRFTFI